MRAVQVAESWAEGDRPNTLDDVAGFPVTDTNAWRAAERTAKFVTKYADSSLKQRDIASQIQTLYCIFGNPFRRVTINPAWLTWNNATIPKLAHAAYNDRQLPSGHLDTALLAILADALEEAGCNNTDILDHLRGLGPHVRGCWTVDLILAKE